MPTPNRDNPASGPAPGTPAKGVLSLDRIVARKRIEVAKAKSNTPLNTLQLRCAQLDPARNFFAAVVSNKPRPTMRVIAEIKRKTPWAGVIRQDFDPIAIAKQYLAGGASALSVQTDEEHFGGHLGYIQQVREAVPGLPVLRNDFIVDEYQIWESRAANADAVLLIADVIPEGELLDMMILARELGMTTLVEAHKVDTLLKVKRHIGFPHAGYSLLGINNRDPRTMKADLSHSIRMAEMIEDRRVLVSGGGIKSADDLKKLHQHNVNIALIGESLLRHGDPEAALRELLGKS